MNLRTHWYWMVGLLLFGSGLLLVGVVDVAALLVLWPLACLGMMAVMMWSMRGMSSTEQHTHADGTDHSHDEPARDRDASKS